MTPYQFLKNVQTELSGEISGSGSRWAWRCDTEKHSAYIEIDTESSIIYGVIDQDIGKIPIIRSIWDSPMALARPFYVIQAIREILENPLAVIIDNLGDFMDEDNAEPENMKYLATMLTTGDKETFLAILHAFLQNIDLMEAVEDILILVGQTKHNIDIRPAIRNAKAAEQIL